MWAQLRQIPHVPDCVSRTVYSQGPPYTLHHMSATQLRRELRTARYGTPIQIPAYPSSQRAAYPPQYHIRKSAPRELSWKLPVSNLPTCVRSACDLAVALNVSTSYSLHMPDTDTCPTSADALTVRVPPLVVSCRLAQAVCQTLVGECAHTPRSAPRNSDICPPEVGAGSRLVDRQRPGN